MRQPAKIIAGSLAFAIALSASAPSAIADDYLQCVPFARTLSGIQIFGDAWTWWTQASKAEYPTGGAPAPGAVLVFKPTGKMTKGHVAVVSRILTERVIQVSHANWSQIGGSRGKVEENVTVVDASSANDWSAVKVWYDPVKDLGTSVYPTYGFIYQKPVDVPSLATVAARVVSPALPEVLTAGGQVLDQATGSDRIAALIQQALGAR